MCCAQLQSLQLAEQAQQQAQQAQQQAEQAQQQADQVQQAVVKVQQQQQAEQAKPAGQATAPAPSEQKSNKDSSSAFFSARVGFVLCAASQNPTLAHHTAVAAVILLAPVTSSTSCHSACLSSLQLKSFSISV